MAAFKIILFYQQPRNTMTYASIAMDKSNLEKYFRNNSYQQQGLRVPLEINHGCSPGQLQEMTNSTHHGFRSKV